MLRCDACAADYPIRGHVPRFVPPENYATGFGLQWNKHARTQYDSHTGTTISADRFFHASRWPRTLAGGKDSGSRLRRRPVHRGGRGDGCHAGVA